MNLKAEEYFSQQIFPQIFECFHFKFVHIGSIISSFNIIDFFPENLDLFFKECSMANLIEFGFNNVSTNHFSNAFIDQ